MDTRFPAGYRTSTFPDWLQWRSSLSPDRLAVKDRDGALSFHQLQEQASNISGVLASWRVRKGSRVLLLLNSSTLYVALVHALARLGAIAVPVNQRQTTSEILWQIGDCNPSLIIYDESLASIVKEVQQKSSPKLQSRVSFKSLDEVKDTRSSDRMESAQFKASSIHSIIYTSGSTGKPKGAVLTASNLLWHSISFGINHGAFPSDRWLLVMPLYHIGGYSVIFRSVMLGSGIVIHSKFDAGTAFESINRDGITLLSLVPAMLESMLRIRSQSFSEKLRLIFLGGSETPPALIRQIVRRKLPVLLTYGMTESCSQIAISKAATESSVSDRNSYQAMFPTFVKIGFDRARDKSTNQDRKVGRIMLSGPTISPGYWGGRNSKAPTNDRNVEWFDTGDVGFWNGDTGFVVLGRENEMIISGGENIYPIEVESPLLEHKAIEEAVVVGREDSKWGQRVEAVLKVKLDSVRPSASELTDFLRGRIGSYKIPKAFHFLDSFPKTQTGKTKRTAIIEILDRMEGKKSRRDLIR